MSKARCIGIAYIRYIDEDMANLITMVATIIRFSLPSVRCIPFLFKPPDGYTCSPCFREYAAIPREGKTKMMNMNMKMLMMTILAVAAFIGGAAAQPITGEPIGGGAHVGDTVVRCDETVDDLKDAIQGCVLQGINPSNTEFCCHAISDNILCACQARLELQPLLAGVIPLFQTCRVDCDRFPPPVVGP